MTAAQNAARVRKARANAARALSTNPRNGLSHWEYPTDGTSPSERRTASVIVAQWELENRPVWRKQLNRVVAYIKRNAHTAVLVLFAFVLGAAVASGPQST